MGSHMGAVGYLRSYSISSDLSHSRSSKAEELFEAEEGRKVHQGTIDDYSEPS